jgi:hypothetical protein
MPHNTVKTGAGVLAILLALAPTGASYVNATASGLAHRNLRDSLTSQQICYIVNGIRYCPTTADSSRVRMPHP